LPCPGAVELGVLLPHLAGVVVEGVVAAAGVLFVLARARADTAACPACGSVSGRVHSRYRRRLADAAIGGRRVVIRLTVRRFFCAFPGCTLCAGHRASAKPVWRTTATTATFVEAVRDNEEVVPVNISTWVLPSGVTVGR